MGNFFNDEEEDGKVRAILKEVENGSLKSGLTVQGIEFRPKENSARLYYFIFTRIIDLSNLKASKAVDLEFLKI
ncbi:hypothetical protein GIB67_015522 [Kingdonia uniflora]|uniref:Uncharacterized protein n=1 Tax=Kingdonia uniflora TaxID=39325 RepID=A0A7J7LAA5_9MAGN|nr:hypothetical protein GIB67_015522 [Kingdonia uniflora]